MPSALENTIIANVQDSVKFDTVLRKGKKIQTLAAKYATQILFNEDARSRGAAIADLETEIVQHFDSNVIPAATRLGRQQAASLARQIGGGPQTLNDPTERARILFAGQAKSADRLRVVQALINDGANTLENRLAAYWLEPGRNPKEKLDQLRRMHEADETRRKAYEEKIEAWEQKGSEGKRPAAPRLDFLARFTKEATQNVREQGRRAGTEAEHTEFEARGFKVFTWITVNAGDACPDCRRRQGTTGDMAYFDKIGRPGSGATVCGSKCYCILVPKETVYHAPGLARGIDVPGPAPVVTDPAHVEQIQAQKIEPPPKPLPTDPVESLREQLRRDTDGRAAVAKMAELRDRREKERAVLVAERTRLHEAIRAADREGTALYDVEIPLSDNEGRRARRAKIDAINARADAMIAEQKKIDAQLLAHSKESAEMAHKALEAPADKRYPKATATPRGSEGQGAEVGYRDLRTKWDVNSGLEWVQRMTVAPAAHAQTRPFIHVDIYEDAPGGRAWHNADYVTDYSWDDKNNLITKTRANAVGDAAKNGRIKIAPDSGVDTMVHELGHELEARLPGAHTAANAFADMRIGKQKPRKLREVFPGSNYRDDEYGADDDFGKAFNEWSKWYVGKRYPGLNNATEIISMGVEKLYSDPLGFAAADPEYFQFIHGILGGRWTF